MSIKFKNREHEKFYEQCLTQTGSLDPYHKAFFYTIIMTAAGRLRRSSIRWSDWGILWNGRCLTARILASPNPAAVCTLSDILMSDAEEKYFLSPQQIQRLPQKQGV